MNGIFFKDILIVDINHKKAKHVSFQVGLNVITSTENHVGKSSVVKSLYYCLGAEVEYDGTWDRDSKLYVVRIDVNGVEYTIARQVKKFLIFHEAALIHVCQSVSKELAPALEEIFGFSVYLPGKHSKKHELAPPVFTYLPYYIDQDTGWGTEPYESFSRLDQFKKDDRIKSLYYHLRVYTKWSVDIQAQIDHNKERISEFDAAIQRFQTTLETILPEVKNLIPAEDIVELEKGLALPKQKIETLIARISESRNELQTIQSTLSQHYQQLHIIEAYNKMKKPTPQKERDLLSICPQCGYEFDGELYHLVRKQYSEQNSDFMMQQIQLIIDTTAKKLEAEKERYVQLMAELKAEEQQISQTQEAYETYIKQRGLAESIKSLQLKLGANASDKKMLEMEIRGLQKQLRDLPNKKEIDEKYIEETRSFIMRLGAWDSEYDGKIGLLKPLKGQGTLSSKIILAQYLALFSTMEEYKVQNVRFPFVIDSPRSKEPSKTSSEEIINLIMGISSLPQIILATMDFDDFYEVGKENVNIIRLTVPRALLNETDYDQNQQFIGDVLGLFRDIQ